MTGKPVIRTNATPTVMRIVPELAQEIGLNESIMLLQISHYISISNHYKDGDYWTYQSVRDLHEKAFPFWSIATINRTINSLEEKGLVKVGNYNQAKFDKTRWLALNTDNVAMLTSVTLVYQNETRVTQNDTRTAQNETTIPETTTETTAEREPKATMQEAADAIYPPSEETNIIPLHVQRFEQQNNSATHPWIKAYCEVRNMPAYHAKQNEMALIVQYAGKYPVEAFKAYATKRIQERYDIKLYWILQDMPEDLAKAAPAPLKPYRTMSEPDTPPTLGVMSEEDRQHALNLIAERKRRLAQEAAAAEKAS